MNDPGNSPPATAGRVPIGRSVIASLLTLALTLSACGGSAPGPSPATVTPTPSSGVSNACPSGSAWDGAACRAFAERLTVRAPTSFVENGRAVTLEVVLFRPFAPGPFPTVLFHHGSTGDGTDPSLFTLTYVSETVAQFFAERGWLVAFAQRRGRGASDGLYDEGFTPTRSGYSCLQAPALAGFEHAMADVDAAVTFMSTRTDVDSTRLLSAGISRGGVLAVTHAAERPGVFLGAVNFVGGWLGEGCTDGPAVNRALFQRAGRFLRSTIWIYGEADTFYSMAHSRSNFSIFTAAGGKGTFNAYSRAPGLNGHFVINDPHLWTSALGAFVQEPGR